jgi:hypothetical protein
MMFDVVRMGGKRAGQPACSAPPITI